MILFFLSLTKHPCCRSYTEELLQNHKSNMEQLIHRDRNHPSVVMWSISNDPRSAQTGADDYFNELTTYIKQLDSTRPITASLSTNQDQDQLAKYLDVVSFNRFNGWNSNTGRLDMVISNVVNEARQWHEVNFNQFLDLRLLQMHFRK